MIAAMGYLFDSDVIPDFDDKSVSSQAAIAARLGSLEDSD